MSVVATAGFGGGAAFADLGTNAYQKVWDTSTFSTTAGYLSIVSGWWRVTTLSTDVFWCYSSGGTKLECTSSGGLFLNVNRSSLDTSWAASSGLIATNTWYFIATAIYQANSLTSPTDLGAVLWIGSETSAPTTQTLTLNLAGSGTVAPEVNFNVLTTATFGGLLVGNASQIYLHSTDLDISSTSVTQQLIDDTYNLYIQPMWKGTFDPHQVHGRKADGFASFAPRTEGHVFSSTAYIPFNSSTLLSGGTIWPYFYYSTHDDVDIAPRSGFSNTTSTNDFSYLEPAAGRNSRITVEANEPNPIIMRV